MGRGGGHGNSSIRYLVSLSADGHNTYHQDTEDPTQIPTLRTPLQTLAGHTGVVISGDWLAGGDQVLAILLI